MESDTPDISYILDMLDMLDTLDISAILVYQFVRYEAMMLQMLLFNCFTLILIHYTKQYMVKLKHSTCFSTHLATLKLNKSIMVQVQV